MEVKNDDMMTSEKWRWPNTSSIGCLCRGRSRRFQVQHPQKNLPTVRLFGPCFKTGRKRPEKNACNVETLALRENAVTQEHRLNASVYRVRPSQPPSKHHLNLITASFSGLWVPVLRPTGTRCDPRHGLDAAKTLVETEWWKNKHSSTTRRKGRGRRGEDERRSERGEVMKIMYIEKTQKTP